MQQQSSPKRVSPSVFLAIGTAVLIVLAILYLALAISDANRHYKYAVDDFEKIQSDVETLVASNQDFFPVGITERLACLNIYTTLSNSEELQLYLADYRNNRLEGALDDLGTSVCPSIVMSEPLTSYDQEILSNTTQAILSETISYNDYLFIYVKKFFPQEGITFMSLGLLFISIVLASGMLKMQKFTYYKISEYIKQIRANANKMLYWYPIVATVVWFGLPILISNAAVLIPSVLPYYIILTIINFIASLMWALKIKKNNNALADTLSKLYKSEDIVGYYDLTEKQRDILKGSQKRISIYTIVYILCYMASFYTIIVMAFLAFRS